MRRMLFVAAFGLAASAAGAFPQNYDGVWDVDVTTTVGQCEPEIAGTVTIQGGHVVASSGPDVAVWGYVEDDGVVSARFTQGQDILRAQGNLRGGQGSGAWSSNTKYCGGKWTARRER